MDFETIKNKVLDGKRLSDQEALFLFETDDVFGLGRLADQVNHKKNGGFRTYNINRHINPTNICIFDCKFCGFARKPGEEGAYAYSIEEILSRAEEAVKAGAREFHMTGGIHPRWGFKHYLEMIRAVKTTYPQVHIKAFTPVELDWFVKKSRTSLPEVIASLKEAGLGSFPGGGAEIFDNEIREKITAKLSTEQWLATHREAHKQGLKSNCTMLYGHIESTRHRVHHMSLLRALQDETGGFNCFIPLAFQPHNNQMGVVDYTLGIDDLRTIAVARLYLDNFQHIKTYWTMTGHDIAQLALSFGANDIDGTVVDEKISQMAGGRSGIGTSIRQLTTLIEKAGYMPQERDTLHRPVGDKRPEPKLVDFYKKGDTDWMADVQSLEPAGELLRAPISEFLGGLSTDKETPRVDKSIGWSYGSVLNYSDYEPSSHSPEDFCGGLFDGENRAKGDRVCLDLSNAERLELGVRHSKVLRELCESVMTEDHPTELSIIGLKGLWHIAQQADMEVSELVAQLRSLGVVTIESSPLENESLLTNSEIYDLHKAIHLADVPTIAKVELNSSAAPQEPPGWPKFLARIDGVKRLYEESGGVIGCSVESARDATISAVEYLKAVALARAILPKEVKVVSSLSRLPIFMPLLESQRKGFYGQEKLAGLVALAGSDDFGLLERNDYPFKKVERLLRSAGLKGTLRDARFGLSGQDSLG